MQLNFQCQDMARFRYIDNHSILPLFEVSGSETLGGSTNKRIQCFTGKFENGIGYKNMRCFSVFPSIVYQAVNHIMTLIEEKTRWNLNLQKKASFCHRVWISHDEWWIMSSFITCQRSNLAQRKFHYQVAFEYSIELYHVIHELVRFSQLFVWRLASNIIFMKKFVWLFQNGHGLICIRGWMDTILHTYHL